MGDSRAPAGQSSKHPEVQVLEHMMKDGTFDDLRQSVILELRKKEELKDFTKRIVQDELKSSELREKILRLKTGADSASVRARLQRDLMDELRRRLESKLTAEISTQTWKLMSGDTDIASSIDTKVHEAFLAVVDSIDT